MNRDRSGVYSKCFWKLSWDGLRKSQVCDDVSMGRGRQAEANTKADFDHVIKVSSLKPQCVIAGNNLQLPPRIENQFLEIKFRWNII